MYQNETGWIEATLYDIKPNLWIFAVYSFYILYESVAYVHTMDCCPKILSFYFGFERKKSVDYDYRIGCVHVILCACFSYVHRKYSVFIQKKLNCSHAWEGICIFNLESVKLAKYRCIWYQKRSNFFCAAIPVLHTDPSECANEKLHRNY